MVTIHLYSGKAALKVHLRNRDKCLFAHFYGVLSNEIESMNERTPHFLVTRVLKSVLYEHKAFVHYSWIKLISAAL